MKILYVVQNADAWSESYVGTEIAWMQSRGVEVCLAAHERHVAGSRIYPPEHQIGGDVGDAIERFRPDLVHAHWLTTALEAAECVSAAGLPFTVRAHSFDFSASRVNALLKFENLKRIWVFPHFLQEVKSSRVSPLTCSYDAAKFYPGVRAKPPFVLRVGAGVRRKGIEEFVAIARQCADIKFVLVITRADPGYAESIAADLPPNVECHFELPHNKVAELMRGASVLLRSHDPKGHVYGMPVSIAEAMASGCLILAHKDPIYLDFVGSAGKSFTSLDDACHRLGEVLSWPPELWLAARETSVSRAQEYRNDVVLPAILQEWQTLTA